EGPPVRLRERCAVAEDEPMPRTDGDERRVVVHRTGSSVVGRFVGRILLIGCATPVGEQRLRKQDERSAVRPRPREPLAPELVAGLLPAASEPVETRRRGPAEPLVERAGADEVE